MAAAAEAIAAATDEAAAASNTTTSAPSSVSNSAPAADANDSPPSPPEVFDENILLDKIETPGARLEIKRIQSYFTINLNIKIQMSIWDKY